MNSYTIINNKVFVAVEGGVIIFDTQSPWDRRFIANSFYDDIYPTRLWDMLKDRERIKRIVRQVVAQIRRRKP